MPFDALERLMVQAKQLYEIVQEFNTADAL
jgi:hypothetical protein